MFSKIHELSSELHHADFGEFNHIRDPKTISLRQVNAEAAASL